MGSTLQIPDETSRLRLDVHDTLNLYKLSIAVVDPEHGRRFEVARELSGPDSSAVRTFANYLPGREDARWLLNQGFDTVAINLDGNPDMALDMVESLCTVSQATVIVYATRASQDLLMRSMRAGAREFLTLPFDHVAVAEALDRAAARQQLLPRTEPVRTAELFVFMGSKGGAGVTTVATNFAVSLAQESRRRTLFIDMDLPLGDAALDLGISSKYSAVDALEQFDRLDPTFLSTLLVRHNSGLSVLPAPGQFPHVEVPEGSVDKLLKVASQDFDYLVVDAGSRLDLNASLLFERAARIYLVAQAGIPELRNANRLITGLLPAHGAKLEIVLNRFSVKMFDVGNEAIERALTRPAEWRIPSDYRTVMRLQNSAVPLVNEDNPIAKVIRKMARASCGMEYATEKKRSFALFG
jgi:pilus assembly protein CpaE